jgi:hypothetical protein
MGQEKYLGSYWMTLRKGEDTHIALCGELALEEALDMS